MIGTSSDIASAAFERDEADCIAQFLAALLCQPTLPLYFVRCTMLE